MSAGLREGVNCLPQTTGVYLFKDEAGTVLYVGKAIRLKDRVRSYFAKDIAITRHPGIERMVGMAVMVDYQEVPSELEALVLEARLIREYKPRYNIRLRDDKSFVVITIDLGQEFPPIGMSREKDLLDILEKRKRPKFANQFKRQVDKVEYYGPFTSAAAVKSTLKTLRAIWPFRDCSPTKYATYARLGHGCIFNSLGVCHAPCAQGITKAEYRANTERIRRFLRGEYRNVSKEIEAQMETASIRERFEEAARLRDQLYDLEQFQQIVDTFREAKKGRTPAVEYNPERDLRLEAYDISNIQGSFAVGSLISGVVKEAKVSEVANAADLRAPFHYERVRYRKFKVQTVSGISDTDMLREVMDRRLRRGKSGAAHWSLPDLILIDGGLGQLNAALKSREVADLVKVVGVVSVAKGPTRKRVDRYGKDWERFPLLTEAAWLNLAELLREEAHRFAISYYRLLHRRSLLESRRR